MLKVEKSFSQMKRWHNHAWLMWIAIEGPEVGDDANFEPFYKCLRSTIGDYSFDH